MQEPFVDGVRGGAAPGAEPALAALGLAPPAAPRALLERIFALRPRELLRRMPGRETFSWPEGGPLVVKRFQGGEMRDWWYDRLLGSGARALSPGRREWENLNGLYTAGFPVPRALAWAEERGATTRRGLRAARAAEPAPGARSAVVPGARSAVVMARVPGARSLRELLAGAGASERRELGARLVALVARLHDAGWYHRDLYLHQLAQDAGGELVLFDLGRARRERHPRRRWFEKDLAALDASAPPAISRAERLRFLAAYLERRGLAPDVRGAWARRVRARSARIRAHVPRHVDPRSA
jgi:tRNA A-37 threonylcarbamoyl transferase component Bud32